MHVLKNILVLLKADSLYPHSRPNHIKVMTLEEQVQFEKILHFKTTPFKIGLLITLYGGLRIGEICALQWKDIHFDTGTIHITKTIIRIQELDPYSNTRTKLLITHPKTTSSHRIIPMPSFIMATLKDYQQSPDDFILTGTRKHLEPRSCLARYKRILRQAGLESFTFHTLRHTFATRCVESGFDAKSLSEILGHTNVNTTLQRYVHPSMELKRAQMERLEKLSLQAQNSTYYNQLRNLS